MSRLILKTTFYMLAGVFPLGVHHIEHSMNPLGHLSTPRGFRRTQPKEASYRRLLFFSLSPTPPPPPTPPLPTLVLAICNIEFWMRIFALTIAGWGLFSSVCNRCWIEMIIKAAMSPAPPATVSNTIPSKQSKPQTIVFVVGYNFWRGSG